MECPKCNTKNTDSQRFCGGCGTPLCADDNHPITKTLKTPRTSKTLTGRYTLLELLGKGGIGEVHKAEDTKLKRIVALKFLPQELMRDEEAKQRFIQEAQAAAALNHPNICTVYEIDETNGQSFIAMEYIKGQSLKEKITSGPLEIEEVLDVACQIAEGLMEAHEKGIVHRDIKPANIMVTDKGQAKIMDFGLAKLEWGADLTKTATIMGTVAYMSPEQAKGEKADHRTDIWSLGCVLYEMLSGEGPFKSTHDQAVIHAILNRKPRQISNLIQGIPKEVETIIIRALAKDPADRYQKVRDLWDEIKSLRHKIQGEIANRKRSDTKPSIAVLPFVDMSPQKDQEYFCDGIAEELINALSQIEDLRVIARTSSFAFKGKNEDIRQIGKKLDVQSLLEGSVRKSGEKLRITVQLIHVTDGSHLWSERYDRNMEDIFAIQDEISATIVDNLKIKLSVSNMEFSEKRQSANIDAYDAYLRGIFYHNKMTETSLKKAISCFEEAISIDPDYAPAHTGLAEAHLYFSIIGDLTLKDAVSKIKESIQTALKLDPNLAEAHLGRGMMAYYHDWDRETASSELKKALELNPNSAKALVRYAIYLMCYEKKFKEALALVDRAEELDPLDLHVKTFRVWVYCFLLKLDEAYKQAQKIVEIAPDYSFGYYWLGIVYGYQRKYKEAVAELENAVRLGGRSLCNLGVLGFFYGMAGRKRQAMELARELEQSAEHGYGAATWLARVYHGLRETDKVLKWLERAYNEHNLTLFYIPSEPFFADLLSNQRFISLMRKMGFEVPDVERPESIQAETKPSIAVLPFIDMSPDKDQEYFCDGLSESIINSLTQIKDLRVVSRTSAFSFKGKETDIREIGNKLNVSQVLEGSLQKSGKHLRITAQLINIEDGFHLWSERFDRELSDVFKIQDEISVQITNKLKVKLASQEKDLLVKRYTEDLEAYNLYLKGRYYWNKTTPDGFYQGIKYFQDAIQKDPGYALAYTGIAFCYIGLGWYYHLHPKEAFPKAREAVIKAMELDDSLAEGQTALGVIKMVYDRDWDGAKEAFELAIKLNDGFMMAHSYYSIYLAAQGKRNESIAEGKRALELDPLTLMMSANLGMRYYYARDFDAALEEFERMLDMDPHFWIGHFYISFAYTQKEMYEKAMKEITMALEKLGRQNPLLLALLGIIYGFANQKDEAKKILAELMSLSEDKYVAPFFMALLHVSLDQKDQAFEWLERSYAECDHVIAFLKVEPMLDKIRADLRYAALLKKMNLE